MSWMPVSRDAGAPDETDYEALEEEKYNAMCDRADDAWSERYMD